MKCNFRGCNVTDTFISIFKLKSFKDFHLEYSNSNSIETKIPYKEGSFILQFSVCDHIRHVESR